MARSAIAVTSLAYNTAGTVTADAVDVSNEHTISLSGIDCEKMAVRMYGGTGDGFTAVFKAGDVEDTQDLSVAVAAGAIKVVVLESARFRQSDGSIEIDTNSSGTPTAATFEAYEIP